MTSKTTAQKRIKKVWWLACSKEKVNPKKPEYLPRLFAIDGLLKIKEGYTYSLNCKNTISNNYCASHIAYGDSSDISGGNDDGGTGYNNGCSSGCSGGCAGGCGGS